VPCRFHSVMDLSHASLVAGPDAFAHVDSVFWCRMPVETVAFSFWTWSESPHPVNLDISAAYRKELSLTVTRPHNIIRAKVSI